MTSKYNPQKTTLLAELREAAGQAQDQAGEYFSLEGKKRRDSIGRWEAGNDRPHIKRRSKFISYLWHKLDLRHNPQRFQKIWDDVLVGEWGWPPLSDEELPLGFPKAEIITSDLTEVREPTYGSTHHLVPFLAPPRPPYELVGREDLLYELKQHLLPRGNTGLCSLNGLPGVGKTALAVELAHDTDVLTHFRDGVLWAGLGREPDVSTLLARWGEALDISLHAIAKPIGLEDLAKAVRHAIGMRHMLLVIDDAWQIEAALAFQVGGPNCAHLLTTRLPDVARDFAETGAVSVHELRGAGALELLRNLAPEVVEMEPDEVQTLIHAVGSLPLAIILMAKYARKEARKGHHSLQAYLRQLKKAEQRLKLAQPQPLLAGHPSIPMGTPLSLMATIKISEEALDELSRYALWALSIFPSKPNTFSRNAALDICNTESEAIEALIDFGLLETSGLDRYSLHQTIADYAKQRLTDNIVCTRMIDFFVRYTENHERNYKALDLEVNNILAALHLSLDQKNQRALIRGANAIYHFLETRGLHSLATKYVSRAEQVARLSGDAKGLAHSLFHLGRIARKEGNYRKAEKILNEGLAVSRKSKIDEIISAFLQEIGALMGDRGNYRQAEEYYVEGLTLAQESGNLERISALLQNMGVNAGDQGDYSREEELYKEALVINRALDNTEKISALLMNLGVVSKIRGDYTQAEEYYQESLAIARQIGDIASVSRILANLGGVAGNRGNYDRAIELYKEALDLARNIAHQKTVSGLLGNLGNVSANRGNYVQAEKFYKEALYVARESGHTEIVCQQFLNLGGMLVEKGDFVQAEEYLQEGLALTRKIVHRRILTGLLAELGGLAVIRDVYAQAEQYVQEGLTIAREIEDHENICLHLKNLGVMVGKKGYLVQAEEYLQEGLALARKTDYASLVSDILNVLGHFYLDQQNTDLARSTFLESLEIARRIDSKPLFASALLGLAQCAAIEDNLVEAQRQGQESLAIFEDINYYKTTQVREWLAELSY